MALRINQNLFSLLIQKNINSATKKLTKSFDRLSSGERIRRSGDDPSGLSMSQQMRYEIRGLQRNQQNIGNAFGLMGTAETSLAGIQTMLQRARELVIQAASDILSVVDRGAIQIELDQLIAEIERTAAKGTTFLGRPILDGSVNQQKIQIGTRLGQSLGLTIRDFRVASFGQIASATGASAVSTTAIGGSGADLSINGIAIPASKADGISTLAVTASAIAKAAAINSVEAQTGVRAIVQAAEYVAPGAVVKGGVLDGALKSLTINGVSIGAVTVLPGDSDGALVSAINNQTLDTGVTATVLASGELQLSAADGRNIVIGTTGGAADDTGLLTNNGNLIDEIATGKLTLQSDDPIGLAGSGLGTAPPLIGFSGAQSTISFDPSTAIANLDVSSVGNATESIRFIDAAMKQLGNTRARLGALQNRLEGVTESIGERIEELSASDSRIRDTDFALETTRLTQAQILQEAGIALLVQANLTPRTALSLLQR